MKIVRVEVLIDSGDFSNGDEFNRIRMQLFEAIRAVQWPPDSGSFTIHPVRKGNGVKPIKSGFMLRLQQLGWDLETRLPITSNRNPGPIDATYRVGDTRFAVEWETENISSSHRALGKMTLGMKSGRLCGGALILPTGNLARYLTDRIGNYPELEPYFDLWKSAALAVGVLMVVAIEQDAESTSVDRITKGTDGRALI